MEDPLITTSKYGFVEAVEMIEHAGVFMNIGISKDILLSKDFLPTNIRFWPKNGDIVPCILVEKSKQIVARIITPSDLVVKSPKLEIGQTVSKVRVFNLEPKKAA